MNIPRRKMHNDLGVLTPKSLYIFYDIHYSEYGTKKNPRRCFSTSDGDFYLITDIFLIHQLCQLLPKEDLHLYVRSVRKQLLLCRSVFLSQAF